ncbi:MAG: cytochrome ubiquinol oxidase subunit I [Caldilineaceae bacterium]|nr:cytochrome ubiquinol oxidase subunit I [Caldilineaceae bacterium]
MNPEFLSRLQFTITASFHFIYPPISMGLGLILVIMGILYVRTQNPVWRRLSFFWIKIYGLVFALGVATGIVQEFEFGTNWSEYSRFVGNIFGSLLAAEGIFAFFLEGGFLGLMLFGGNRVGPRLWLFSIVMVVFGAHFSATWIIMANSWMQTPAGYELAQTQYGTLAFMTSFPQVIMTPSFLARLWHTLVASWLVGSSLVLSVSAYYLLKGRFEESARAAFKTALPVFVVFSIVQAALLGPQSAENVTDYQPEKLAAMEGVWEDTACAPMTLAGWVKPETQRTVGLKVPCLLSWLAGGSTDTVIQGLNSVPRDEWAPVGWVFQSYHLMIVLGGLFVGIGLLGLLFAVWGERIWRTRWLLRTFVSTIFLTELATMTGWWTAELGRQPWIVWGLMRVEDAVSPNLTTGQLLFSNAMFVLLYTLLFVLFIYLLNEKIMHGPEPVEETTPIASLPDSFRDVFRRHARA